MTHRLFVAALALCATVTVGCGGDDVGTTASVAQTIGVETREYSFVSDVVPDITAGDRVRFVVENTGRLIHEMQVLDGTGRVLDRTPRLAPGESAELVVAFEEPGVHRVICDVDDHLTRGQQALFEVSAP